MQLLSEIYGQEELQRLKALLESNGVPIFINSADARRVNNFAIWAYIDAQFEDARALLSNPEHEVSEPVDVAAFYIELGKTNHLSPILKFVLIFGGIAILLFAMAMFLVFKSGTQLFPVAPNNSFNPTAGVGLVKSKQPGPAAG